MLSKSLFGEFTAELRFQQKDFSAQLIMTLKGLPDQNKRHNTRDKIAGVWVTLEP